MEFINSGTTTSSKYGYICSKYCNNKKQIWLKMPLLSISRLMIDTVQDLDWSFMEIYFAKKLHIFSYLLIPTKRHRWITYIGNNVAQFFLDPTTSSPRHHIQKTRYPAGILERVRRETVPMATFYLNPSFFNIIPPLFKLSIHVRFCLNMWNWNLIRIWSNVWRIPISKLNYNCKTYTTYLHWKSTYT